MQFPDANQPTVSIVAGKLVKARMFGSLALCPQPAQVGVMRHGDETTNALQARSRIPAQQRLGAERTTFYSEVQALAKRFQFAIEPDPNPGAGHYYRSDHFSLARVGIPSFSVSQGSKFVGKPADYGKKWQEAYTAHDYHQPSDDYRADWDFAGNAKLADFAVALGRRAAALPDAVGWQPGDEFEAARKKPNAATK